MCGTHSTNQIIQKEGMTSLSHEDADNIISKYGEDVGSYILMDLELYSEPSNKYSSPPILLEYD